MQQFVHKALLADRRDVAVEVNKVIKVLGSPKAGEEHGLLKRISEKLKYAGPYYTPPMPEKEASTWWTETEREVRARENHFSGIEKIFLYVGVATLGLVILSKL